MTRSSKLLFALALLPSVYFHGWFFGASPANSAPRYAQVVSIVAHGTLNIDRYFETTCDWSRHGGHYYPNKPPGMTLVAVAPYFLLYHAQRLCGAQPAVAGSRTWKLNHVLLTIWCNGLFVALAALAFVSLIKPYVEERHAIWGALAWSTATLVAPYSTALWAHPHVAALLLLATWCATRGRPAIAGALCGLATLSEYGAVLATVAIGACALRRVRDVAAFCAGGLPALAVMLAYHHVCFGSALATSYTHINPGLVPTGGLFEAPSPMRVGSLLFGAKRGLFFHTPILLLAIPGAIRLWRDARPLAVLAVAVLVPLLAFNAAWCAWEAGWCVGPRFLIPATPFLMLAAAAAFRDWPRAAIALGAISLVHATATSAVTLIVPLDSPCPLATHIYPFLASGRFDHANLAMLVGVPARLSVLVYVAIVAVLLVQLRTSSRASYVGPSMQMRE